MAKPTRPESDTTPIRQRSLLPEKDDVTAATRKKTPPMSSNTKKNTKQTNFTQDWTQSAAKAANESPESVALPDWQSDNDKLRKKILRRLQAVVKGNGIKPEDLVISDFSGVKTYTFFAHTAMRLVPHYQTKIVPGRDQKAEHMPGPQAMHQALRRQIMETRTNPASRQIILDFLHSRVDKGFAIRETRTSFPMFRKDFVIHEGCNTCSRAGKLPCPSCRASGQVVCSKCQSRQKIVCPSCRGTTQVQLNGRSHACQTCHSTGRITCDQCAGQGKLPCRPCAAKGNTECRKCAGTGWQSHITSAELEAQIQFVYDRTALPPEVARMVDVQGSSLVQKGDLQISLYQPTAEEQQREPEDVVYSVYEASVPFGHLQFQINGKPLPATIFGLHGKIIETPPFLEVLIRKGAALLTQAASGKGDVADLIRKAARYRVIRDVIVQAATDSSRKGLARLQMKYPFAIQVETLNVLMQRADKALGSITNKPRLKGLITGLGLSALLTIAYYAGPIRSLIGEQGISNIGIGVIDVLLLAFGCVLSTLVSQLSATNALRKALADLAGTHAIREFTPSATQSMWWAFGGTLIMTASVLLLLAAASMTLPSWLAFAS